MKNFEKTNFLWISFFLGIVIPGILMSMLAFRGIQNDQALRERERTLEIRKKAVCVVDSISGRIRHTLDAFNRLAMRNPETDFSENSWTVRNFSISPEFIFYLDSTGNIHFPSGTLLYIEDALPDFNSETLMQEEQKILLAEAWKLEFLYEEYSKSLDTYQKLLNTKSGDVLSAKILCSIARVQRKAGQVRDAVRTYDLMISRYPKVRIAGGLPAGVVAGIEKAILLVESGEKEKGISHLLELYSDLISGTYILEQNLWEFAVHKIRQLFLSFVEDPVDREGEAGIYLETFQRLIRQVKYKKERTHSLLAFQKDISRFFHTLSVNQQNEKGGNSIAFFSPQGDTELILLSAPADHGHVRLGMKLGVSSLISIFHECLATQFSDSSLTWSLKDASGRTFFRRGAPIKDDRIIQVSFAHHFPPWTLNLHLKGLPVNQKIVDMTSSIYFFILVLAFFVLITGSVLSLRSFHNQLEVTRQKNNFVTAVSHEFRSPLTAIRQLSEMLQQGRIRSESRRKEYYGMLVEESERLGLMVNNLLDFNKMNRMKRVFQKRVIDAGQRILQVTARMRQRTASGGYIIDTTVPPDIPPLTADPDAFDQALINLIDNAVKYSGDEKHIRVCAWVENSYLVISVQDRGIGIPDGEKKRVFSQFFRGESSQVRAQGGCGLGLTLVRQIMEAHFGTIDVSSESGNGSDFRLKFPLGER
jgi:signal transduction histidine kinase